MRKGKLEFYKNRRLEWAWRFKSSNGNIIACSGESYTTKRSAKKGWNSLFQHIAKHSYNTVG